MLGFARRAFRCFESLSFHPLSPAALSDRIMRWIWLAISGGLTVWIKPYGYVLGLAFISVMAFWWWRIRDQEDQWTYKGGPLTEHMGGLGAGGVTHTFTALDTLG